MSGSGVTDLPTIFFPRRSRAPSIVLSDEQGSNSPSQIIHESECEHHNCNTPTGCPETVSCKSLQVGSGNGVRSTEEVTASNGNGGEDSYGHGHRQSTSQANPPPGFPTRRTHNKLSSCYSKCCAVSAKKIYFGICVTICVTASWVGATHCIKYMYYYEPHIISYTTSTTDNQTSIKQIVIRPYNAPFFTTWFCTNFAVLYFPLYMVFQTAKSRCSNTAELISESLQGFRDKGLTGGRFLTRASLFCCLWVSTNYMYIHSLRILFATDVMALFATNVACTYLLSWVILHEQFVGVKIVAVILCDTGIALLAYMDGITGSSTVGGVVLAASAGAGSAVYKVLFKKVVGETTFGQLALFFSLIGICNAALLWPICLALYFSGAESVHLARLPWAALLSASILHLAANMLGNFSIALTYNLFITLGLITAVPVSAALDVVLYGANFHGMNLAGIIIIAVGFFLVMFPNNWPEYISRLLRNLKVRRGFGGRDVRRRHSFQHRHFRRNYGVTAAHGDGQTLLPTSSSNQNTSTNTTTTTNANSNLNHRHNANNPESSSSSQDNNPRRVPNSNSNISTNNNRPNAVSRSKQDGAGDTDTACQLAQRAT